MATKPLDETARLLSLHSLRILDTPAEERFDRITRLAKRMFDVDICLISLVDAERQWFKSKQGLNVCETPREAAFCNVTILNEHALVVNDAHEDARFVDNSLVTGPPYIRFYAGYPVHSPAGKRVGTLCLIDPQPRPFTDADRQTLQDLAAIVDDELAMTSLATVDDLTQVANRRGFFSVANKMLSLCRRSGVDAELLYFDLDGLKKINDTWGHTKGDEVLQCFAGLLVKTFRKADVVARLGGDEFAVLLTAYGDSSDKALMRLERMAKSEDRPPSLIPAWSAGKVLFEPTVHDSIDSLLEEADSRMYDQKLLRRAASAGT